MKLNPNENERRSAAMAERLSAYRVYRTMLTLAKQTADAEDEDSTPGRAGECVLLTIRMREIERLLRTLPLGRERLLLELHYLQGHSIEHCAELLYVSRATAYRLKRRGLAWLAESENRRPEHA